MSSRYWIFQRKGVFYYEDTHSRKQFNLRRRDRQEAETLLAAKREAARQPQFNLQVARVYLSASDPAASTRTWSEVIAAIIEMKDGETFRRWCIGMASRRVARRFGSSSRRGHRLDLKIICFERMKLRG